MVSTNSIPADEDQYVVEVFGVTSHPGADVRIVNLKTGEVREIQPKATGYMSHIRVHNDRVESVDVFATSEIADRSDGIQSTALSNAELTGEISDVISELGNVGEGTVMNKVVLTVSRVLEQAGVPFEAKAEAGKLHVVRL
ncbi:MAG: hypothetical protein WC997_08045 [Porticoccaceae bacterium]